MHTFSFFYIIDGENFFLTIFNIQYILGNSNVFQVRYRYNWRDCEGKFSPESSLAIK